MYFVLKWKLYKVELRLLFNITLTLFTMCSANPPLKREHISNSESLCYHSNSLSPWNIYIMSNVFTMQQPSSKLYLLLTPCGTFPLLPVQQSARSVLNLHRAILKNLTMCRPTCTRCICAPYSCRDNKVPRFGWHLTLPTYVQASSLNAMWLPNMWY